jgi:hypothetical protein
LLQFIAKLFAALFTVRHLWENGIKHFDYHRKFVPTVKYIYALAPRPWFVSPRTTLKPLAHLSLYQLDKSLLEYNRKSFIEIGEIYFWTATINSWHKLLLQDQYKNVIIESLQYLSDNNKIDVFAFVVMPNHIHLYGGQKN